MQSKARLKGDERRDVIIASAIRLFAENGFRGTTTRQLAAAVGVTEPVLYQHFRTKRELYDAILETKTREGHRRLHDLLGPHLRGKNDRAFFHRLAELVIERYEHDPGFVRLLLFAALERHELADRFYERQVMMFYRVVAAYVRRRIKEGAIREMDPKLVARVFLGMVANYALNQVLFGERILKIGREEIVGGMVSAFLEGIHIAHSGGHSK